MAGLVLTVIAGRVTSDAVTVALPAVFRVTLRVFVPLTRAELAGKLALASLELIATVSLVLTTFQLASTALTVTLKPVPAVCVVGVPVLPPAVPGAAFSPGANSCNLVKAAGLTTTLAEVDPARPRLAKSIVMVVATLWDRFVKLAKPLAALAVTVPCKAPLPALRLALIAMPLSLLRKLPNWSSIRITGCWAKATPAVAVAEGCG